jgi:hypothetical protein
MARDSSRAWGVFPHAEKRHPTGRGFVVREMESGYPVDQHNYGGLVPVAVFSRRAKAAAERAAKKLTDERTASNPRRSRGRVRRSVQHSRKRTWTQAELYVDVWEERDRLHIALYGFRDGGVRRMSGDGELLAEWWDDDARQMFEDGFFERRNLENSVVKYAEEVGLVRTVPGTRDNPRRNEERSLQNFYLLVTAVEGGINYWATIQKYHHSNPDGSDDVKGAYAALVDRVAQEDEGKTVRYRLTPDIMARGLAKLARGEATFGGRAMDDKAIAYYAKMLKEIATGDADFDASDADNIAQAGLFKGDVIYG